MKTGKWGRNSILAAYLLLLLGALVMVLPFVWTFLTSFKTQAEAMAVPLIIFPGKWNPFNYISAWKTVPFPSFFFNTFVMLLFRNLGSVLFSAMAGYAFARMKFPGRNIFFILILMQMMVPSQIFILPQYMIASRLGWTDTIKALVMPGIISTFGTFLLRQFFMSIPADIEEAAVLDGCNPLIIFVRVMLPLSRSGVISLAVFTSLFAWKDFMWPLIVNISPRKMTLSSGLNLLRGQYTVNYPELMAGSMIAIIPMLVLFLIFQKQFITGISTTGSKQ
ncbi:MAG: carbohydrate ABC transporter permease [Treponema sp.]|jgi:multiple sugar transport system permease protein|nr:carbohydrate ABC transporter permease [Treponema sp.]